MSAAQHTPWQVGKCNYPQPSGRNFYVFRALRVDSGNSHYEQIKDSDGWLALFETETEAQAIAAEVQS